MNPRPHRDLALINAAGFLRSLDVGLTGVVLGIYLFRLGLSSLAIGLAIAAGLAGSALATVCVSFAADRVAVCGRLFLWTIYEHGFPPVIRSN